MRRRLALVATILLMGAACGGEDGRRMTPPTPTERTPIGTPPEPPPDRPPRLRRVAMLQQPLAMAVREGDETLYVAQKTGQVVALTGDSPATILDLADEVSQGSEQGLLGLAFSPDGAHLYINYTDTQGDTHIMEFEMAGDRVDEGTRREVLVVDQPFSNHNGGHLAFGPDGYLYIGLGDGGSGGDPQDNAEDLGTLLGKMLRIDPRPSGGRAYTIPPDNPFLGREGARPEIWAFGLRNPWRYSFDRETGDLWIADVGQQAREEINRQPARSSGGENYGWDAFEGSIPFEGSGPSDAVAPVFDYGRDVGGTIIGGYVYRGTDVPSLRGAYVFADFFAPRLMALRPRGDGFAFRRLPLEVPGVSSFGQDLAGELYVLSLGGGVFRIVA